jgi:hypothetical protein
MGGNTIPAYWGGHSDSSRILELSLRVTQECSSDCQNHLILPSLRRTIERVAQLSSLPRLNRLCRYQRPHGVMLFGPVACRPLAFPKRPHTMPTMVPKANRTSIKIRNPTSISIPETDEFTPTWWEASATEKQCVRGNLSPTYGGRVSPHQRERINYLGGTALAAAARSQGSSLAETET